MLEQTTDQAQTDNKDMATLIMKPEHESDQASMSAVKDLDKRLDESTVRTNQQMSLFHLPGVIDKNHSNLIDVYDAIDKYRYGKRKQVKEIEDASRKTVAVINKTKIHSVIRAANMTDSKGKTYLVYPGEREERVEEALRKMAVNGHGVFIDGSAGVTFTLYSLQKELKLNGHPYTIPEIKDAILINRRAGLTVTTEDDSALVDSGFFEAVGLVDRKDYQNNSKAKCYVRFNSLVTESILRVTYRRYDYKRSMGISSSLARYMFKRMSLYYIQASHKNPYTPSLLSFLEQSPRDISTKMSDNIRAMNTALKALIAAEVVSHYEEDKIKEGRRIADVRYKIYPHEKFIQQQRSGNKVKKDKKLELNKAYMPHVELDDTGDSIF